MAATILPYNPRYCFAPVEDTEVGVQQTRIFVEGTCGALPVLARGGGCTAWSSMRRFDWRLSTRG